MTTKIARNCSKCEGVKAIAWVKDGNMYQCKECFLDFIQHKLKTSLTHVNMTRGSDIMLGYSGGLSSSVLLYMMHKSLSGPKSRHTFNIIAVHIDISSLTDLWSPHLSLEKFSETKLSLQSNVENLGFKYISIPLEAIYKTSNFTEPVDAKETEKLVSLFKSLSSNDDREDVLRFLIRHILHKVSVELNIPYVLLGDNASRLAETILNDTTKARGYSIPLDLQLRDERFNDVVFVKPIRDLLSRQLAIYGYISRVPIHFIPSFLTKSKAKSSISLLTEALVARLQEHFPSTAPTVLRTGMKIKLSPSAIKIGDNITVADHEETKTSTDEVIKVKKLGVDRRKKHDGEILPNNLLLCPLCAGALPDTMLDTCNDYRLDKTLCFGCDAVIQSCTIIPDECDLPPTVTETAAKVFDRLHITK